MNIKELEALEQIQELYLEMTKMDEAQATADYKVTASGRKVRSRKLVDKDSKDYKEVEESINNNPSWQKRTKVAGERTTVTAPIYTDTSRVMGSVYGDKRQRLLDPNKRVYHIVPGDDASQAAAQAEGMDFDPSERKWYHIDPQDSLNSQFMKESVDERYNGDLEEKHLTDVDKEQKETAVKGLKKNLDYFKDKYGKSAEAVMYATATNIAKKQPDVKEDLDEEFGYSVKDSGILGTHAQVYSRKNSSSPWEKHTTHLSNAGGIKGAKAVASTIKQKYGCSYPNHDSFFTEGVIAEGSKETYKK